MLSLSLFMLVILLNQLLGDDDVVEKLFVLMKKLNIKCRINTYNLFSIINNILCDTNFSTNLNLWIVYYSLCDHKNNKINNTVILSIVQSNKLFTGCQKILLTTFQG